MSRIADCSENELIAHIRRVSACVAPPAMELGIGDDAALMRHDAQYATAISCDTLVEGQDFQLDWGDCAAIGFKAVAVNVSDMAAMGATPKGILVSLAMPAHAQLDVFHHIVQGIADAAAAFQVALYGGDLSSTNGPIVVTITIFGQAPQRPLLRGTTCIGDDLWVSGPLGEAAAGLAYLMAGHPASDPQVEQLIARQRRPIPHVALGRALAEWGGVHAAMDVSDGLASDVPRLLAAGQGALLQRAHIPISPAVLHAAHFFQRRVEEFALAGGEDFCLLFATPVQARQQVLEIAQRAGYTITVIGSVTAGGRCEVRDAQGITHPLSTGFDHFAGTGPH